ncbi:MAG: sigma-70 family RNA polymerase sigma factor [Syntrophomonadaceae bacterium]|nr:sigma-70 family RNA polymerase sigma factor [Syntrophomonadaceae bacterium]MDD3889100.1 sigma-70 family RNA polymerase sigma factor [Syntrophomonadaceae bacterium]MDD4549375.1 sigma-70 family RNA polymerase sigma factor [Syntrophomonadaceae bacterium]
MVSEAQLIKKSLQGDMRSFEELVEQYQNKVYALSYRYMGNEEDAYDMTQEAFIKAYRSLRSFKGDSGFGTWLYRIVTNVCLDEIRRRKRRIVPLSLDEPLSTSDGDEVEKEIVDTSPTADILYEQKEFAQYIQNILDQMKSDHKTVIILRDMMELSYEEIAQVLNCSMGTVKSRLSRARSILRKKLGERELLP